MNPKQLLWFASVSALALGLIAAPVVIDLQVYSMVAQSAWAKNGNGNGGGNGGGNGCSFTGEYPQAAHGLAGSIHGRRGDPTI